MSRLKFSEEAKAHDDIIALCESYSKEYNSDLQKRAFVKEEEEPAEAPTDSGEISVDDMYNTVDIPGEESPEGPSFNPDEIELSEEDKEAAKSLLVNLLNDVTNSESISEPALEMIVNEVATQSSYLNEAEEGALNGPVEKDSFIKSKIEAIKKYLLALLGFAEENEGALPEGTEVPAEGEGTEETEGESSEGSNEGSEESAESKEHEAGETSEEEKKEDEEKKEETTTLNENAEGVVDSEEKPEGEETSEVSPEGAETPEVTTEGVCTECDADGVLEVDPKDTIRIVGEEDGPVTAITEELPGEETPVEGAPEQNGDLGDEDKVVTVADLKSILSQYLGDGKASNELFESITTAAVLPKKDPKGFQKTDKPESETLKPQTSAATLLKVTPKGFQKTTSPNLPEGTKKGELKTVTVSDATLPKVTPKGFQETAKPTTEAPTTTPPKTVEPTREPAGSQTHKKPVEKETAKVVAAIIHEGSERKISSFLAEAREAIKNAKKQINS